MDNITHSLIGIACAEAVVAARPNLRKYYRPILITSVIGSSLPDIDFLYTSITSSESGEPIGKILHHRGHTHTLIFGLPGAAFLSLVVTRASWLFSGFKKTAVPLLPILLTAFIAILLHVFADSWNNYGVHPFWPFYNGWFYGDSVFIVEPALWGVALPFVYFRFKGKFFRALVFTLLGGLVYLMIKYRAVHWSSIAVWLALVSTAFLGWRRHFSNSAPGHTPVFLAAIFIVVACFAVPSKIMAAKLRGIIASAFESRVHEVVLSPYPFNPFCWLGFSVETKNETYFARRFTASLLPSLLPAANCPNPFPPETTAPLLPVAARAAIELEKRGLLVWKGQYQQDINQLQKFWLSNCELSAAMQFYRVPFVIQKERNRWMAGDLRYDRTEGKDFPELWISDPPGKCPAFLPNWIPPRADLLRE